MVSVPVRRQTSTGAKPLRRHELTDEQWARIEHLLPGRPGGHGGVARDNRRFVNAVYDVAKTGIPWRDRPEQFGKSDTVFHRFNEWCKKGVWQRVLEANQDPDLEWLLLERTVTRAHPHAASMNTADDDQALGDSRGGFGTKIHLAVDALGNPLTVHQSPGQDADVSHAEAVLGDKGYDSEALAETIEARGTEAVIPPQKNRTEPRDDDRDLYKERCVGLLKQFRRVATCYEKTARNFLGMATFAALTIWLR